MGSFTPHTSVGLYCTSASPVDVALHWRLPSRDWWARALWEEEHQRRLKPNECVAKQFDISVLVEEEATMIQNLKL